MNAANDDFEGPLPVMRSRASARRNTVAADAPTKKPFRERLGDLGEFIGDLIVPACFAFMLFAAGCHLPS